MVSEIANFLILGKPLIFYFGVLTLLTLYLTAFISATNTRGFHWIPFKWHPRLAVAAVILATVHAIFGLSTYLGF